MATLFAIVDSMGNSHTEQEAIADVERWFTQLQLSDGPWFYEWTFLLSSAVRVHCIDKHARQCMYAL